MPAPGPWPREARLVGVLAHPTPAFAWGSPPSPSARNPAPLPQLFPISPGTQSPTQKLGLLSEPLGSSRDPKGPWSWACHWAASVCLLAKAVEPSRRPDFTEFHFGNVQFLNAGTDSHVKLHCSVCYGNGGRYGLTQRLWVKRQRRNFLS